MYVCHAMADAMACATHARMPQKMYHPFMGVPSTIHRFPMSILLAYCKHHPKPSRACTTSSLNPPA